jgi:hypothetical protein
MAMLGASYGPGCIEAYVRLLSYLQGSFFPLQSRLYLPVLFRARRRDRVLRGFVVPDHLSTPPRMEPAPDDALRLQHSSVRLAAPSVPHTFAPGGSVPGRAVPSRGGVDICGAPSGGGVVSMFLHKVLTLTSSLSYGLALHRPELDCNSDILRGISLAACIEFHMIHMTRVCVCPAPQQASGRAELAEPSPSSP